MSDINPTTAFVAAAQAAVANALPKEPEVINAASGILVDLAAFKRPHAIFEAGHEVRLTQDMVRFNVLYGAHAANVKESVLGIFTNLPEFGHLPEREFHR